MKTNIDLKLSSSETAFKSSVSSRFLNEKLSTFVSGMLQDPILKGDSLVPHFTIEEQKKVITAIPAHSEKERKVINYSTQNTSFSG